MIILWKCPSFSFRKNKSGFQIFSGSVRVKNRIWPCLSSYCSLSSVHSSRNVNCVEYSCWIRDKERMFKGWENIKFHEEKERVVREIKMKETEISFETKYVCNRRLYIALSSAWSKFHSLVLQRPPQDINRTEYRKWSYTSTFLWHDLQIKLCLRACFTNWTWKEEGSSIPTFILCNRRITSFLFHLPLHSSFIP